MPRLTTVPSSGQPAFEEAELEVGGITYRVRELSAGEYDECLTIATQSDGDVDMVMMVKLMLIKGIVEPSLNDTKLSALPYKTSRSLKRAISQLHWGDEQETVAVAAEDEEAPNP